MWGKISSLAFFISLLSLTLIVMGYNPFFISYSTLFYVGVVSFGLIGFILSILSNFFDVDRSKKKNKIQTFIFYIGMILVFMGIVFHLMHWPYTTILLGVGLIVSLLSFFIHGDFNQHEKDEDILDNDIK